jgi:hypothetical protein
MARFYFHMRTGDHDELDDEGCELCDLAAARKEAFLSAREILSDAIEADGSVFDCFIIADEDGRELETVSLKDALPKGLC